MNNQAMQQKLSQIVKCQIQIQQARKRAQYAVDQLDPPSIRQMKCNIKPPFLFKITLDAIAILFGLKLSPIQILKAERVTKQIQVDFWKTSYDQSGRFLLSPHFDFLLNLKRVNRKLVNQEKLQLLQPLLGQQGQTWYNQQITAKYSKALCMITKWIYAVYEQCSNHYLMQNLKLSLQQNSPVCQQNLSYQNNNQQ